MLAAHIHDCRKQLGFRHDEFVAADKAEPDIGPAKDLEHGKRTMDHVHDFDGIKRTVPVQAAFVGQHQFVRLPGTQLGQQARGRLSQVPILIPDELEEQAAGGEHVILSQSNGSARG